MKLDDILHGDDAFVFMERYVDEAAKTYSPFAGKSEVAPEYQPKSDRPSFELISVNMPVDRVAVLRDRTASHLDEYYVRPGKVRFLVHPETWASSEVEYLDELRGLPKG